MLDIKHSKYAANEFILYEVIYICKLTVKVCPVYVFNNVHLIIIYTASYCSIKVSFDYTKSTLVPQSLHTAFPHEVIRAGFPIKW